MNDRHPMARGPQGMNWHLIGGVLLLIILALSIRWSKSGSNPIPPNYAPNGITTATAPYNSFPSGASTTPFVSAVPGGLPQVTPAVTPPSVQQPVVAAPTPVPSLIPSTVQPPTSIPPQSSAVPNPTQPWWRSTSALPAVNALLVDPVGIVWAGTKDGLAKLQNGAWTLMRSSDSRFPSPNVSCLAHDGKFLWIGTSMGLVQTEDGRSFRLLTKADGLIHEIIWSLHWDGQILWVGTQAGVSFRLPDGSFQSFDKKITGGGLADIWIGSIQRRGNLAFFGNDDGLSIWDFRKPAGDPTAWETIDMFATNLPHNWILSQALMGDRLWVGTPLGLARLDQVPEFPLTGSKARWEIFSRQRGLPGDRVNALAASGQALWIGTNAGLSRYQNGSFRSIGIADGLMATDVLSLSLASDTLWIGTSAGVQALDPNRL